MQQETLNKMLKEAIKLNSAKTVLVHCDDTDSIFYGTSRFPG